MQNFCRFEIFIDGRKPSSVGNRYKSFELPSVPELMPTASDASTRLTSSRPLAVNHEVAGLNWSISTAQVGGVQWARTRPRLHAQSFGRSHRVVIKYAKKQLFFAID